MARRPNASADGDTETPTTAAVTATDAPAPKRRGRTPGSKNKATIAAESGDDTGAAIRRRRRRRGMTPAEIAAEINALVEALLKSRGGRGATQDEIQTVVEWARSVRDEGMELMELAKKPRRAKAQAPAERQARHEMNRSLLEGILAGRVAVDIHEGGDLVFLHGEHLGARNTGAMTSGGASTAAPEAAAI